MPSNWSSEQWLVFAAPLGLLVLAALVFLVLRKTFRTRIRMERQLRDDPDINDWLVIFGWSRKVLYLPTVAMSIASAAIMYANPNWEHAAALGGIWLGVFFLNFLIDEYEISIKLILIAVLFLSLLSLWLHYMGLLTSFLNFFKRMGMTMSGTGYLILAIIFLLAIAVSWVRGLFYYVAITPNFMNVQTGPTETGEQVSREEYSTRIDTGDFLERMLGFGRIIVTFSDHRRQPLLLLVGNVGKKAARLESVRGKIVVDRSQEDSVEK